MRLIKLSLLCSLLLCVFKSASETPMYSDTKGKYLDILHEGRPVARYMYENNTSDKDKSHETYKAYHHVFAPDRTSFITKGAGGKFTHHRGIFLGWAKLGHGGKRYDHWHMKNVRIVHQKFIKRDGDDKHFTMTALLHWNDPDGKPILEEKRTFTVYFTDKKAYFLADFVSELTAVDGEVELSGDPEHAGVQYRPHNDVVANKSAKYTFPKEGIDPKKDKDLSWVAMSYQLGKSSYTVQHMRHPENPKNSVYSAYRDYGRFGNYFVKKIPAGKTLTLRYRFRITSDKPSVEEFNAQHAKFIGTKN